MKKTIIFLGLLLISISFVFATEYSFQPNESIAIDTYIYKGAGNQNYVGSTQLVWNEGTGNEVPRSLMNLSPELSTIPANEEIINATLQFYNWQWSSGFDAIFFMNHSFDEGLITWNNCGAGGCLAWYNSTNLYVSHIPMGSNAFFNVTLNANYLEAGLETFIIIGTAEADTTVVGSSNHSTIAWRPTLFVITVEAADTTPPIISNLNCTSCNVPNGDAISPYETEDTTPTFKFTTNENAWCAIGVSNVNYTTMGASRNCTNGEGTPSHICTLTTQDKFTSVGEDYLYLSCKDSSGNEGNATDPSKSNSGAIVMGIQGVAETGGDDAIELGIIRSEIGGIATIYSSQRVSARNLATNQFTGIFDKVAVNGNKRWAFNYVSSGESQITGLFNLTPVLYVLQLQNQTNTTITDQVGKLINSTYP